MDWATLAGVAAVLVPVAALLLHALGILEKLGAIVGKAWTAIFRRSSAAHPSKTLIVIQRPQPNSLWWHMGNTGTQPPAPMMQVCADVNATNIWNADVVLAGAILHYRPWWSPFSRRELGNAHIFSGGNRPIGPNEMEWVRAHFMFNRPWQTAGRTFIADVALIDQFNNHHWLRNLRFPYH